MNSLRRHRVALYCRERLAPVGMATLFEFIYFGGYHSYISLNRDFKPPDGIHTRNGIYCVETIFPKCIPETEYICYVENILPRCIPGTRYGIYSNMQQNKPNKISKRANISLCKRLDKVEIGILSVSRTTNERENILCMIGTNRYVGRRGHKSTSAN